MKTITIRPNRDGQYQAFVRMAVDGEVALDKPFSAEKIEVEKIFWDSLGFRVVVAQSRFETVE